MWLARDKDNSLRLFPKYKPIRNKKSGFWTSKEHEYQITSLLDESKFPELTWESEPLEVEVVAKSFMDAWRQRNEYMKKYL